MDQLEQLFELGQIVATKNVLSVVPSEDILKGLRRHAVGDWGELCDEDRESNEEGIRHGERLLSAYLDRLGNRFWIITEWDRSITSILLPEDY